MDIRLGENILKKIFDLLKNFKLSHLKEISLEKKIILCFTGSLALFFLIVGSVLISRITENAVISKGNEARAELAIKDNAILSLERAIKGKIKLLSKDTSLMGDAYDISHTLRQFGKDNEEFSQVMFGRNDGEFVETPKNPRENAFDPRNTIWYKDASAAGGSNLMIVSAPFQGLDGKPKIGFYSAVNFYGESLGVVGGTVDFSTLVKMSSDEKNLIVLDIDDNVIFDSENSANLFNKLNKGNLDNLSLVGQKSDGVSKISFNNKNMLAVVYKSDTTKLKYIKLIDYNEAISFANTTKYIIIVAFILMLIISFVLCKLLYKDIKNSFMNIEAQTEAIGEGNLDSVTDLKEGSDEMGRLSFAFGKMAGSVKSRLMTMETESQNLRALLKDISEKLEITKETLESLSEILNKAATSTDEKLSGVKSVSEEIENLSGDFVSISDLQNKLKSDIIALVKIADDALKAFKDETENSAQKFKQDKEEYEATFKSDSKAMNDALQKIADSASEISLMAFSAALEAAKGKDEKSKFAKIAEDIRKLADTVAKGANEGLKSVEKFAPKIAEPSTHNLTKELETIANAAKQIEIVFSETHALTSRLETAGKTAETAAKETLLSEKDAKTALEDATIKATTASQAVNEAEQIAKKAFE